MKRKAVIVLVTVLVLAGFSGILNRMSYSPDFSIMDVLSSASKKEKADPDKSLTVKTDEQIWGYTSGQLGLSVENLADVSSEAETDEQSGNKSWEEKSNQTDSQSQEGKFNQPDSQPETGKAEQSDPDSEEVIVQAGNQAYVEKRIQTGAHTYQVLWNVDLSDEPPGNLRILSDETNASYKEAVQDLTEYLQQKGYEVSVIKCRGQQLLAFGHAGKFDVFLLREEAAE